MKIVIFLRNYKKLNVGINELYDPQKYIFFTICNDAGYKNYLDQNELKYFEEVIHLSNFSFENIYSEVRKIRNKFPDSPIRFITTRDQSVHDVGKLSFELGLEQSDLRQFVDKFAMKSKISNSIRIPKYISLPVAKRQTEQYEKIKHECRKIGYPLFVKPTSLYSSQFTNKLNHEAELLDWWGNIKNYPDLDFEIDEFIDGELFHCDTFIKDSKFLYTQVSKYSRPCAEFMSGIPMGTIVIPETDTIFDRLKEFSHQCLHALTPPSNGITHMEIFLKNNGELIFLEVAARPPGATVPLMYEKYLGVNVDKEHILLNIDDIYEISFVKGPYAAAISYPKIKGMVKQLNQISIQSSNDICWFIKEGDILDDATDITNKAADIILWNENYDLLLKDYNKLKDAVIYELEN